MLAERCRPPPSYRRIPAAYGSLCTASMRRSAWAMHEDGFLSCLCEIVYPYTPEYPLTEAMRADMGLNGLDEATSRSARFRTRVQFSPAPPIWGRSPPWSIPPDRTAPLNDVSHVTFSMLAARKDGRICRCIQDGQRKLSRDSCAPDSPESARHYAGSNPAICPSGDARIYLPVQSKPE